MKISMQKPPIYERLEEAFGKGLWERGVLITYGDTVHCAKGSMSADLQEHEQVHIDRQAAYPGGHVAWWERYLIDPKFRLEEELAAYRVQVAYINRYTPNKRKRQDKLHWIAKSMSESYGDMITYGQARNLLRI